MATTADTVVVRLEADTAGYLRDINNADRQFTTAINHINTQAPRAAGAMNGLSGQVGNVAAQFQDIGVQLAGGQSPLLIALQQGTQLSAVLGQTANPIRALGAAFASIVSPVSLVTIATIALGGAAIQYFSTILTDGRSSTEVIKEQNDLIRRVAENWGAAVPALRAYVDELDRAAASADLNEAYDTIIANAFAQLRAQIPDLRAELAAARIDIEAVGGNAQEIDALQASFNALAAKVEDGTATTADLEAVMAQLAGTTGSATVPSLINLQGVLASVASALASAANAAARANAELAALNNAAAGRDIKQRYATEQFAAEQERINGLTTEQLQLENEIARVKSEAARGDVVLSEQQALTIAQQRLSAEERRAAVIKANNAAVKSGGAAANDAERERQAVLDLIDALITERDLVGASAADRAVSNALRRAGAAATEEQALAIEELIRTTYAEADALRVAQAAQQQFQQIATQSLTSFISDLRDGKSAAEALSNVFDNLADQLINIAVQGLVKQAFGGLFGGGGGFLGGLFGGKGFASGTANTGGSRGQVAGVVHGQEAVIPLPSGGKVPVQVTGPGAGGGAVAVEVVPSEYFDVRVRTISGDVATSVTGAGIAAYDGNLYSRMAEKQLREGR